VTVVMFLRHEMTLTELGRSAKMLVPTPRLKSVNRGKGRLRVIRVVLTAFRSTPKSRLIQSPSACLKGANWRSASGACSEQIPSTRETFELMRPALGEFQARTGYQVGDDS
jgi:hypothetical protein